MHLSPNISIQSTKIYISKHTQFTI